MSRENSSNRDEFSSKTKRTVAMRASYMCSNPNCHQNTVGPHSDPEKSLGTGVAAHICAAAPGGARYDAGQKSEQRSSMENAIWLCHTCGTLVDGDVMRFSVECLQSMKSDHEAYIRDSGWIPELPQIELKTHDGLLTLLSGSNSVITGDDCAIYKDPTNPVCTKKKPAEGAGFLRKNVIHRIVAINQNRV